MQHQWDSSTPTFRSVYHFSILPQSQVRQGYYHGRRLGDVTLSSRRRLVDDDFEKTQNLLARRQQITNKERNEGRRRSQSRRKERAPSKKEQQLEVDRSLNNAKVPTRTTESSPARQSVLSYSRCLEAITTIILFTTALLLCIPSTLEPTASRETRDSAAGTDSFEGIGYELVPDLRRWGKFYLPRYYYKTRC